jgi:hypothetical protein
MSKTELCAWLRANSSGIYRPAAEAAAMIEADAAELESLRRDAERWRFVRKDHAWGLLKHFPAQRPYEDATEVIDEAIDAAMKDSK